MTVAPVPPDLLDPLLDDAAPPAYFSAGPAAPTRTLLDILDETARRHPDAPAVDDGVTPLTYRALLDEVEDLRRLLAAEGVGAGDRVGVRVPSGTADLYVSILAVLAAGAAYVPVDAEDPDERAELVFTEAAVHAVIGEARAITRSAPAGTAPVLDRTAPDPAGAVPGASAPGAPAPDVRDLGGTVPDGPVPDGTRAADASVPAPGDTDPAAAPEPAGTHPGAPALGRTAPDTPRPAGANPPASVLNASAPDGPALRRPLPGDDAWIIFTSGSTGKPKGVAVTHGSAAAFVDAEARLFLRDAPLGPGDRVLAGLSVAFDASCEEMWLAWRHGACLVPAPRSLVRTGIDLGPWLVEQRITVVSTVPTLAALWPAHALDDVRLLIFGGEACPPELAERMAVPGREVWNTYGPTEATVVACAAPLTGRGPVRIGLPLDGWELAVVDGRGEIVPMGATGELVIGGAGLARYLDPVKDAEKYAPLPSLGWTRAYRSGDLVRAEEEGLLFVGRADEQIKLGGRRIELGEIDAALQALPGVAGAASAIRTTAAGTQILVGYVVPDGTPTPPAPGHETGAGSVTGPAHASRAFDRADSLARLRKELPAALVPLLAVVAELPTRTSGKVDRDALPWPLPDTVTGTGPAEDSEPLTESETWLAGQWTELLGVPVSGPGADFFAHGGGSLAAARLVSRIRERYGTGSVGDIYQNPTLGALARTLETTASKRGRIREVRPVPVRTQAAQLLLMVPLLTVAGLRWSVVAAAVANILGLGPGVSWWWIALGWLLVVSPPGKIVIAAGGARLLLRGVRPGTYARGGGTHLRLWTAERLAELSGATSLAGSWLTYYARALGARVGENVDLHALPPVTGMLRLGRGAAVEPEADLSGHWLDGDRLHIGALRIGADAVVGARSTLFPGARIGKRSEIAPGSGVTGSVPAGERWSGVPATRDGKARRGEPRPPRRRRWTALYSVASLCLGLLPAVAALPALLVLTLGPTPLAAVPLATVTALVTYALLILVGVRALSVGLREGSHPVAGRIAWQAWVSERLMDMARVHLFPLYASLLTPVWLRALGMRVGRGVEASTVLALPAMTTVGDGAFLADDTMVASYELGGGRLRIAEARVGKRAFLGNSGMTAAGRRVPKRGLVGVLSATPKRAKAGSSWLGMPPMKLPRSAEEGDQSRTFAPPARLKWARAAVEICRIVPVMCSVALAVLGIMAFAALAERFGWMAAVLLGGAVLLVGGLIAALTAIAVKWVLVGRFRAVEHPLWSAFVWRNELADTFVEVLAVPWLVGAVPGTPLMNLWLRGLGARIGRGAWCETYWLPEADLVTVGRGASVNRGCVVQTHLFHDRIMRMDNVVLGAGATLGPHGIALPGAVIGDRAVAGPASLVMRGERVPADTRWLGNPIAAWRGPGPGPSDRSRRPARRRAARAS
ncbi:Pls/PosA family non-ribosomal peptide synthetase [Streptomyces sp. NPDC051018]|uniref:Pls/PosA family non-ribosomal peptide synthetase n=1 Tax=Streptomyces sp. NPDC051018 TaxID=3365639 RepID=UPI0037BB8E82